MPVPLIPIIIALLLTPPAVDTVGGAAVMPDSPIYVLKTTGQEMEMAVGLKDEADVTEELIAQTEEMSKDNSTDRATGLERARERMADMQTRIGKRMAECQAAADGCDDKTLQRFERMNNVFENKSAQLLEIQKRIEAKRAFIDNKTAFIQAGGNWSDIVHQAQEIRKQTNETQKHVQEVREARAKEGASGAANGRKDE